MSEDKPDYVTDALQMMGIDLEKPKEIIQEISGFTPLFDVVVNHYKDETRAAVHGAMWRFCQMEDRVCKASLNTIAEMIGVDISTVSRHAEELVRDGYFVDLTPNLRNKPHVYVDTGKVVMKSSLTAGFAQSKASIAQSKASIAESRMSKVFKKDSDKQADALLFTPSNTELQEQEACDKFEQAFRFTKLPWHSTRVWSSMARFVTEIHKRDPLAFGKYIIWRADGGKYQALSNKQIRLNPQAFMDCWGEFENPPENEPKEMTRLL